MSNALETAARRAVEALRHRATIERRTGRDSLAIWLDLEANRLESPLLADEAAAKRADVERATSRLTTRRDQ